MNLVNFLYFFYKNMQDEKSQMFCLLNWPYNESVYDLISLIFVCCTRILSCDCLIYLSAENYNIICLLSKYDKQRCLFNIIIFAKMTNISNIGLLMLYLLVKKKKLIGCYFLELFRIIMFDNSLDKINKTSSFKIILCQI